MKIFDIFFKCGGLEVANVNKLRCDMLQMLVLIKKVPSQFTSPLENKENLQFCLVNT